MKNILLVDDDREVSHSIMGLFDNGRFSFTHVEDGTSVETMLKVRKDVDVLMLDVNLPSMSGLDLLKRIHKDHEKLPIIIISGDVSTENAIEAMREGAFEYLTKPFEIDRLIGAVNRACGVTRSDGSTATVSAPSIARKTPPRDNASSKHHDADSGFDEIVGCSPEIVEIAKLVGHIARTDAPTLIFGEPGTGKELIARAIHRNSSRRVGPFLTANCSSLADTLLESEIFGHEKGAFTGAYYKRLGKLEQADHGTLFFDEVADLSLMLQAKLLRSIEQSSFERVGGAEKITSDARIIAATSKSLVQVMKEGAFRVDLFYRLKIVSIYMPPLRERKGDVQLLTEHFLTKFAREMNRPVPMIDSKAQELLNSYSWPGNVRELENNIHTALVMAKGDEIHIEDLPINAESSLALENDPEVLEADQLEVFNGVIGQILPKLVAANEGNIYNSIHSSMERALISSALKLYGSNQVKTSEALGISRNTLRDRIARYNLY
ncbi:sigma-54-dependent Fis family transcriptional regulator [bacterium AH-315-J21]|nr:sigma-54-dependent Fis family transcriptional regulator [bacterium AH-315-J21]